MNLQGVDGAAMPELKLLTAAKGFEPAGEPENHPFTKNLIQESSDTKSDHSRSFFMVRDLADLHATEIRVYNF
jgi:hypothetical protein